MKHKKWKIISKEDVSPSKWFPIVKEEIELPSGKKVDYFKSVLPDVVMVVALTKNKEIIFVRQYRHGIGEICLEFPAGRIESGDTAEETAVRELEEETGIRIYEKELKKVVELWTEPSKSTVKVKCFFVTDVDLIGEQKLEDTEQIEVVAIPISQIGDLLESGKLHASDTVALLLYVENKYSQYFD